MGLKNLSYEERLKELRLANWEKRCFNGEIINAYKYLMEDRKDRYKLLLTVPSDRPRYNRHKSKYMQFHLNTRKHILTVIMVKHRCRLPGEAVKYPSLEIFRI